MNTIALNKKLSVKAQTIGALVAVAAAVALPQLVHLIGANIGMGTGLGEMLLPMHLPIILAGLLAGPFAAGIAGALSPVLSFLLTDMPTAAMLPFMVIELCAYGVFAGVLRTAKIPSVAKVLAVQVIGRAVKAAAILIAFYAFSGSVQPAVIVTSITAGLVGIAVQLIAVPLILRAIKRADNE